MCSAVQVLCVPEETDFLKEVPDSSAVVSEPGTFPMRGNAGSHVPRTTDVCGEVFGPGQELILAHAATMLPLLAVLPLLLLSELLLVIDAIAPLPLLCYRTFWCAGPDSPST